MKTVKIPALCGRKLSAKGSGSREPARRGTVLLETALVFGLIILPISFAIIQFGIFYSTSNALTQLTRDGARFAAVYCIASDNPATPVNEGTDAFIVDHIRRTAQGTLIADFDPASIIISPDRASRSQYGKVTVSIAYDLNRKSYSPFGGRLFRPGVQRRTTIAMIE